MKNKLALVAMSAMLGASGVLFSTGGASAASLPLNSSNSSQASSGGDGIMQLAQDRRERRMRSNWDRRRDGDRCSRRTGDCRHYRNGFYYQTPWWTLPLIIGGAVTGSNYDDNRYDGGRYGNRHVQWCSDRYRSYNPRTNTWVAYSGAVNQCNSPY